MKVKQWLLLLGMALLITGGSVTAQASPLQHFSDQLLMIRCEQPSHQHMIEFRQSQEERRKMLDLLNIEEKAFEWGIRHGKSIAEIAVARGVSENAVIKLIERQIKNHIASAKREHRISSKQASEMKAHAREHAREIVNRHHRQS